MVRHLRLWTLLAAVSAAAMFFGSALAGAVSPNSGPIMTPSGSAGSVPVSIHFKPHMASGVQGGTVTVHAVVHDNGSFAFVAKSCILWYRIGTTGAWTKAVGCLNPSAFPHTFSAHSKSKFSDTQKVSMTFPTGTYQWKIELVGTYNGHAAHSHTGILSVTIT
jgi:hypothetical protein